MAHTREKSKRWMFEKNNDNDDSDYEEEIVIKKSDLQKRDYARSLQTLTTITTLIVTALAVFLSWTINTSAGLSIAEKVFYAVFAGLFGPFYLIYFILVSKDMAEMKALLNQLSSKRY